VTKLSELWPYLSSVFADGFTFDPDSSANTWPKPLEPLAQSIPKLQRLKPWPQDAVYFPNWVYEKMNAYTDNQTPWEYRISFLCFLTHMNKILNSPLFSLARVLKLDDALYSSAFIYIASAGQYEILDTYLHEISSDDREVEKVLLIQNFAGQTMLHAAGKRMRLDFIRYLIRKTAELSSKSKSSCLESSPLYSTLMNLRLRSDRSTALHHACSTPGGLESVKVLLEPFSNSPSELATLLSDPLLIKHAIIGGDWDIITHVLHMIDAIDDDYVDCVDLMWAEVTPEIWNLLLKDNRAHALLLKWITEQPRFFPEKCFMIYSSVLTLRIKHVFLRRMIEKIGLERIMNDDILKEVFVTLIKRHPEHAINKHFDGAASVIQLTLSFNNAEFIQFVLEPLWPLVDPLIIASSLGTAFFFESILLSRPLVIDWIRRGLLSTKAIPKHQNVLPYLHCVVFFNDMELLRVILEHGDAEWVREVDGMKSTCLHLALRKKHWPMVRMIVHHYPNLINLPDKSGCTVRAALEKIVS